MNPDDPTQAPRFVIPTTKMKGLRKKFVDKNYMNPVQFNRGLNWIKNAEENCATASWVNAEKNKNSTNFKNFQNEIEQEIDITESKPSEIAIIVYKNTFFQNFPGDFFYILGTCLNSPSK